jgi:hypothetical protein
VLLNTCTRRCQGCLTRVRELTPALMLMQCCSTGACVTLLHMRNLCCYTTHRGSKRLWIFSTGPGIWAAIFVRCWRLLSLL